MFNWLWDYTDDPKFPPVTNEERLSDWGFEQVYGNFETWISGFHAADATVQDRRRRPVGMAGCHRVQFRQGPDGGLHWLRRAALVWPRTHGGGAITGRSMRSCRISGGT